MSSQWACVTLSLSTQSPDLDAIVSAFEDFGCPHGTAITVAEELIRAGSRKTWISKRVVERLFKTRELESVGIDLE